MTIGPGVTDNHLLLGERYPQGASLVRELGGQERLIGPIRTIGPDRQEEPMQLVRERS